ncbi:MAG: hypothetical protein JXM73_09220 [Anaerolineae bacterium]|nr:hypothetical protein [Anaerolineae bacterium]
MRAFGQWLAKVVRGYWLLLLILGAMAVAYLALRTPASQVASMADVDAILLSRQPVLVEFFSNA